MSNGLDWTNFTGFAQDSMMEHTLINVEFPMLCYIGIITQSQ